ncbi:WecB/TagA/CpsF family glycosyltransferase [Pseudanabaena sp. 'Roaring Creek']|uniref:WecB/TagA/CpsF family glycosyltransferase n=1 Tax=Pseudanabaena sp. 'Roaring Creek' TaxID=1681830 RepID=UPI0006D7D0B6|nr:WecB/TagA/CpsF family glycosyltransferase [Pseudanabaena sp. 'Roaring Creek']
MSQRIPIVNVGIDATSYSEICDRLTTLVQDHKSCYIVAANVHVVMSAYWDKSYCQVLANAEVVTPDGMPLVWGLRSLGIGNQQRVYGPDLMLALCDRAARENLPIYLFGATAVTLDKLEQNLRSRFPDLAIAGKHAPPYLDLHNPAFESQLDEDIKLIAQSGAKVLFVALGCPKQELWMSYAQSKLSMVMVGVGAAFDFHSGQVSQAPRWMMAIGLEWLYRFVQEPKRLWQRYLINNPCFVFLFAKQHLQRLLSK